MLTKYDNGKRDTNAFVMLSDSYLYDKSDNAFQDGSFILPENSLPIVSAFEN